MLVYPTDFDCLYYKIFIKLFDNKSSWMKFCVPLSLQLVPLTIESLKKECKILMANPLNGEEMEKVFRL